MEVITTTESTETIERELLWLEQVIDTALTLYFNTETEIDTVYEILTPTIEENNSAYARFIVAHNLQFEERVVLGLAMLPYLKPQALDVFLIKNKNIDKEFSEFGGMQEDRRNGFIPTLETACFVLGGGREMFHKVRFIKRFDKDHFLFKKGVLELEEQAHIYEKLAISHEYLSYFLTGKKALPQYSSKFPAKQIHTKLEWEDLIVEIRIKEELKEIQEWLQYRDTILNEWELNKTLKAGYKVLFYGAPGTGKTLSASLLGKATGKPVFRVDLSLVVSKYIGETEKNLGKLFDEAESKEWILFFDEADALFSKRTQTNSSNDRHANQEVAYLLQRIEDFDGLVILATNLQSNIDEAFLRRFQTSINFPKPQYRERLKLWQKMIGDVFTIEEGDEVLERIAKEYDLSGGEMINVVRYCAIKAASNNTKTIKISNIITGIKREYNKSNKTFN